MTLKERAERYADRHICHERGCVVCTGLCSHAIRQVTEYIHICKEQREEDINRAVEWLQEKCYDDSLYSFDIEEFKQMMKGEQQ